MKNLEMIKKSVVRTAGRSGLVLKKYSPEILMTVGVTGVVASTILACRATLKIEEILDRRDDCMEKINFACSKVESGEWTAETYSDKDKQKDLIVVNVQTCKDFAKVYWPAVTLGVASIGCILGAHNIMSKRNVALMAAYKAVEQSFADYRKRVVEELGVEKDHQFKYGVEKVEHTTVSVDENGKRTKNKEIIETVDPNGISQYARFFDEANRNWTKTPEYNLMFLKSKQNYLNDLLHARGHVFLNEVYDELGMERSQAGCVVGWVMGNGDDFIDFGMYDVNDRSKREFVNGYERSILLDFNVDGVVYDLLN